MNLHNTHNKNMSCNKSQSLFNLTNDTKQNFYVSLSTYPKHLSHNCSQSIGENIEIGGSMGLYIGRPCFHEQYEIILYPPLPSGGSSSKPIYRAVVGKGAQKASIKSLTGGRSPHIVWS